MDPDRDLYELLGVPRDAEEAAIRKAYRRLAREHHPDLNSGDREAEERFKRISRAWEVLSDPAKRKDYDEFGEISLEGGFDPEAAREAREAFGNRFGTRDSYGGPGGGAHDAYQFGDLDDLLGRLFAREGGPAPGGFPLRGSDLETHLELDFLDAIRGGEKSLILSSPVAAGERKTLTVRIPPGVDTGGRLRLAGKGAPGVGGGPPGDLWVSVHVRPHPVFRREGRDLCLTLPVSIREAAMGGTIDVPTLDGRAALTLPPGTQGGTRLRLRGKGVPGRGGAAPGDLLVRVQIRVPQHLDAEAKAALDALEPFEDPAIRKELWT